MTNKSKEADSHCVPLKNEFARQRWELFHRAIAHAKQSNNAALDSNESDAAAADTPAVVLTIVK